MLGGIQLTLIKKSRITVKLKLCHHLLFSFVDYITVLAVWIYPSEICLIYFSYSPINVINSTRVYNGL